MVRTRDDLRWLLFEEWCSEMGPDFCNSQINIFKEGINYYSKYKISFISKNLRKLNYLFNKNNQHNLVFEHDFKYKNIINKASIKGAIILGIRHYSLSFILNNSIKFIPLYDIYIGLYKGIVNSNENQLYRSLNELKKIIKDLNPVMIIFNSDLALTGRAMAMVSNELGIPTVEIQHGIYQSDSGITTGKHVDYVFVWGNYFKDLYLKSKVKSENEVKILGYPYELKNIKNIDSNNEIKKLIYFGGNFESYIKEALINTLETINKLHIISNRLGFKFEYRPHPGDNIKFLKSKLPNVKFVSRNETLIETINKGDIFISFNSTALIEAALHSKLSIQLKSYDFPTDDFEKLGVCPKSFNTFEELEVYLKELSFSNDLSKFYIPVNENYIKIPDPDPGTRFLELIDDILLKNK